MIYYISDLHFFHEKIIPLAKRPFNNSHEMALAIIKNWKSKVTDKDKVYLLGDIAIYHAEDTANILLNLPGKKILITGNHDKYNLKNRKFRSCFSEITPYKEIWDGDKKVVLCHYPIEEWDGFFRGFYHLHGHVHSNEANLSKQKRRFNVSVDVLNYAPCTLDEIIALNNNSEKKETDTTMRLQPNAVFSKEYTDGWNTAIDYMNDLHK